MRSIYRSKNHTSLIETLTNKDRLGTQVFPTIKALQCYAALLGFQNNRREPLEKNDRENIEWHTFNNDGYTDYIYMIALAETKDLNILKYDEENSDKGDASEDMVKIFEEYANGGFEILQKWLNNHPVDPYGAKAIIEGLQKEDYLKQDIASQNFDDVEF